METQLYLYEDEIREAITHWLKDIKYKTVKIDTITEKPAISFHHLEDDRASGCFNYHADVKIE